MEIEVEMISFVQRRRQEQDAQGKKKIKLQNFPEKIHFGFLIKCCVQGKHKNLLPDSIKHATSRISAAPHMNSKHE